MLGIGPRFSALNLTVDSSLGWVFVFSFSRVSLCGSVKDGTHFVEQIGLKLKDLPFLTSSKF